MRVQHEETVLTDLQQQLARAWMMGDRTTLERLEGRWLAVASHASVIE